MPRHSGAATCSGWWRESSATSPPRDPASGSTDGRRAA
jgi:hypothetical protein